MADCVYVSATWGIHDTRWVDALERVGYTPRVMILGHDASNVDDLRQTFLSTVPPNVPVLAGPLDSITRWIVDLPLALVGLSWGYDLHRLAEAGETQWLTKLDGLIVDSTATRAIAEDAGVPTDRITTLPWGVDLDQFAPEGPAIVPATLGLPEHTMFVLSLRAHEPLYRVADIIAAFALLAPRQSDLHLVIGHGGSLTGALRRQVGDLDLVERVHFVDTLEEDDLPALMRSASAYITASEVDGASVTLLQAMACGVPVVVSENPGNQDWVVPGETGDTFPVGDVAALETAIESAIRRGRGPVTHRALECVRARADWVRNIGRLSTALADASRRASGVPEGP